MNEDIDIDELAPWLAVVITLVGAVLRLLLLDYKGMWLDETFSVWLANHTVADLLHWTVNLDQHPPLYYLLLRGWIALNGDTPYHVRLLSVLFSAGAIPMMYLIGKRMSGALMGLAAAVLLAVSPFNIRFAQETRMYTLLTFNAAVAIYALVRLLTDARAVRPIGSQFLEYARVWRTSGAVQPKANSGFSYRDKARPQTGWRGWLARHRLPPIRIIETDLAWIAFIVFSAATMLTHNTAIFFPIAANVFVFGLMLAQRAKTPGPPPDSEALPVFQAPSVWNWVKAQVGILLLWSPWIGAFIQQARRVDQEFWIPKPDWDTVVQALQAFLNDPSLEMSGPVQMLWVLYALALGLGVWHYRKKLSHVLFLAALFAIPFLGELLVSLRRPIFYDRTLIWITIPLLLLLAAGIAQLKYRFLVLALLGILTTNNLFAISDYHRFVRKEDWSTPAGYVANFAEEDDLVLFNAALVQIPFDYYFEAWERQYAIQVEKRGVPEDMLDGAALEPRMTEGDVAELASLVRGRDRVWLVYSHDWYTDPEGLVPQTLAAEMALTRERYFYGGRVQLYEKP